MLTDYLVGRQGRYPDEVFPLQILYCRMISGIAAWGSHQAIAGKSPLSGETTVVAHRKPSFRVSGKPITDPRQGIGVWMPATDAQEASVAGNMDIKSRRMHISLALE
jgi:hypothetical protein